MQNLDLDQETLFKEICERALEEGVNSREAYNEFVEFVVQEKIEVGEEDKNDDVMDFVNDLKARWPMYQEMLGQ